jgi:uncharacterized protein YggU (UPF0235/DUF167 family)
VLALVASRLGVATSACRIVRGESTPWKTVAVRGVSEADARERLLEGGGR